MAILVFTGIARMVQKIERQLSCRFTIVKIENTTKAFSMLNRIIR